MATSTTPQLTDFTFDVLGRYTCNGLDEALQSANTANRPDARPFDIVILGGGSFGGGLAQHLLFQDKTHSLRTLHEVLRQQLYNGLKANKVKEAMPLADLPIHLKGVPTGQEDLFKLEAPLAVQSASPRAGFFAFNKFSSAPLLMSASRAAYNESG